MFELCDSFFYKAVFFRIPWRRKNISRGYEHFLTWEKEFNPPPPLNLEMEHQCNSEYQLLRGPQG